MKIASALPKGDANGLDVIEPQLLKSPHDVHALIVLVDCKKTTRDHGSGDIEATARIRRVEVVLPQDHEPALMMLRRALEKRTGAAVLPYDLEVHRRAAFDGIDLSTGEILNPDSHLDGDGDGDES